MLRKNKWSLSLMARCADLDLERRNHASGSGASQGSKIDAVLVMDASNSMKTVIRRGSAPKR